MYIPPHFAETDPAELQRIVRTHPLGVLCTHGAQGIDANHLPFLFDADGGPQGRLLGHVARANPLWQGAAASGSPVLVVFRGAEGYVSPNGYPSKHETHRAVPTWNYEVVHVHGTLVVHDDEKFTRSVVARLTHVHEAGEPIPWKMGDAPADYLAEMLRAIVGFEVQITRLEGKRKLSQNRSAADQAGAAQAVQARGNEALATAMRRAASGLQRG